MDSWETDFHGIYPEHVERRTWSNDPGFFAFPQFAATGAAETLMPDEGLVTNEVLAELGAEPGIEADRLSVSASDGVIVLSGTVDSYLEKVLAEQAVVSLLRDSITWTGSQIVRP